MELKELKTERTIDFDLIREKYHRGILTFLAQDKTLKKEDREDITQEIFIKIYRNLDKMDPAKDPGPWVYTISRRTAIDFKRSREKRIRHCEFDELASPPSTMKSPEESLMEQIDISRLDEIMNDLPLRSRRLLFLIYWEEMSCRQTGEILGMPTGTVKYELHRLRKKIRRQWHE